LPLENIVKSQGDRFLEQHKCVEKYKYELSSKLKKELSWDEAYFSWCEEGYAKRFAEVYDENKDR